MLMIDPQAKVLQASWACDEIPQFSNINNPGLWRSQVIKDEIGKWIHQPQNERSTV